MFLVLVVGLVLTTAAPTLAADPMSGAIWTTNSSCAQVNQNHYEYKTDVYLNGGPQGGGPGLPDGWYYVLVTDPSGHTVLGNSTTAVAQVLGGSFVACYQLTEILYTASSSFTAKGYDDTPNHGNEYKVWVSQDENFPNNESKTDNFKVRHREPVLHLYGTICVGKFYDADMDGVWEISSGEQLLADWTIEIYDAAGDLVDTLVTNDSGYTCSIDLLPGTYTVTETMVPGWGNTTPASVEKEVAGGGSVSVLFSNVLLLQVTKTANPTFTRTYSWAITKDVDKTSVKQVGGTATFNYTVNGNQTGFVDSDWMVSGNITVTNQSDYDVTGVDVTDAVPGGICIITDGTNVTVPANDSVELEYFGTFAAKPDYNTDITNTATATWADGTFSVSGNATFQFTGPTATSNKTVTITDTFNGSTNTLGTLTATDAEPWAGATFTYARTVTVPTWNCVSYTNTARIVEIGQTASQTVTVCGPAKTGGLTKGFWQNKNGQGIIKNYCGGTSGLTTWLRQFAPFQDLSASASCNTVATYVYNVIKAAEASGSSMNPMLKAQMLATALDVYFSNPALGGNRIGAPAPIGGVCIDLTKIYKGSGTYENVSSSFGGASSLTVLQMLTYAASQSNAGGSTWYGQVKATQELAKDAFDAINNQWAFSGSCP